MTTVGVPSSAIDDDRLRREHRTLARLRDQRGGVGVGGEAVEVVQRRERDSISSARDAASASAGAIQRQSTISWPSTAGSQSSGAWATKNDRVEADRQRLGRDPARERDELGRRSAARPSSPRSSSRIAAARRPASPSPSAASSAPPGKTHTPPMKRASGVRRTISSSSVSSPPRTRITPAATRGVTGGRSRSACPHRAPRAPRGGVASDAAIGTAYARVPRGASRDRA